MSVQKKPKASVPPKAVSNDELDAIMNEINELQHEMAESTRKPQPKAAALKVVPGGPAGNEKKAEKSARVATTEADIVAMVEAEQEENILAEFQAGGSADNNMESTLADLGEEPSAGNSILDQVDPEEEPDMTATSDEAPTEEPSMEVTPEEEELPGVESERKDDLVEPEEEEEPAIREVEAATESETEAETESEVETESETETETDSEEESLSAEELENAILENTAEEDEVQKEEIMAPANKGGNGSDGTLSMTLKGNMTLNIRYEVGGQEVTVGFSDNFLRVQLADGTEFKIPVGRPNALKKVA